MPQTELKHVTVKSILCTLDTYPRDPNFGAFGSTISRFRDTYSSKFGNALNDPKRTWTLNSQKYPIYTIHLPQGPKFGPFRSTTSSFQDIIHFIIPIEYHVKRL